MSNVPNDYEDDEYDDGTTPPAQTREPRKLREALDRANAENAELRAKADRADALEKTNALYQANLGELNDRQRQAILATADDTSAEGYRKTAEELGFVTPAAPAAPPEDIAAYDRTSEAVAGTGTPDAATYEAEIAGAGTEAEVLSIMAKYNKPLASYD